MSVTHYYLLLFHKQTPPPSNDGGGGKLRSQFLTNWDHNIMRI